MSSFTNRATLYGFVSAVLLTGGLLHASACGDDDETSDDGAGASSGTSASTGGMSTASSSSSASSGASGGEGTGGTGGVIELEPWDGQQPVLTVAPNCDIGPDGPVLVLPSPRNVGHLAAVRLTPPQYPFEVTEVVYELGNGELDSGVCNASLAHRVEVFKGTMVTPSNAPTLEATIQMPAEAASSAPTRLVKAPLPAPITLAAGEHLFVAVEMAGTPEEFMCVWMCEPTGNDDRNYWSNATMTPYSWVTLASYDNPNDLRIGANGAPQ